VVQLAHKTSLVPGAAMWFLIADESEEIRWRHTRHV